MKKLFSIVFLIGLFVSVSMPVHQEIKADNLPPMAVKSVTAYNDNLPPMTIQNFS